MTRRRVFASFSVFALAAIVLFGLAVAELNRTLTDALRLPEGDDA